MRKLDEDNPSHFMKAGQVPTSWRAARRLFTFSLEDSLPFVNIEHQDTWNILDAVLGLDEPIDVPAIRGPDRLLTRAIAQWAYTQVDQDGHGLYGGIRYVSRLGDYESWAIFEGTPIEQSEPPKTIEQDDETLGKVAQEFQLTIH